VLTPRPRVNLILYYGVLAPRAAWRSALVPATSDGSMPRAGIIGGAWAASRSGAYQRAELMRRTFGVDVLACPRCGGRLRLVALIEQASVIQRILRHLGLPSDLPEPRPARAPPGSFARSRISRKTLPNSTAPAEGMASRTRGVGSGRPLASPSVVFRLPLSADLPKIAADSGLIRAVEGGKGADQGPRSSVMLTARRP
jgi:hypothetical protein